MLIESQELQVNISLTIIIFSFTLFLICFPFLSLSQVPDMQFEKYTVVDGLSQSHVTCILQDRDGFMWFGTGDGLNKYDGYAYLVYRHSELDSNSLSNNNIVALTLRLKQQFCCYFKRRGN